MSAYNLGDWLTIRTTAGEVRVAKVVGVASDGGIDLLWWERGTNGALAVGDEVLAVRRKGKQ